MALELNRNAFTLREFKNRGVVKIAPDVLVKVASDETTVQLRSVNKRDTNVNGVTSVSVTANVDPPGSNTATVEITAPIYEGLHATYWEDPSQGVGVAVTAEKDPEKRTYLRIPVTKRPFFVPMMEIEIFLRGRYLVENEPVYYRAFWGYINNVEESFSAGAYKISLNCVDMLHWWSFVMINMHPTPASDFVIGGGQTMTAFSTIFKAADPFTIMATLTKGMGMNEFMVPDSTLTNLTARVNVVGPGFKEKVKAITAYWQRRFAKLGSNLRMYGARGIEVQGNVRSPSTTKEPKQSDVQGSGKGAETEGNQAADILNKISDPNQIYKVDDDFLGKFTTFFDLAKMGDFSQSEYMSKLDIATVVKNKVDYEFFQDVTGELIFKPPFYNVNTKYLFPYKIEPYDIINASFAVDPDQFVTAIEIKGSMHGQLRDVGIHNIGFHMDIDLTNKYGLRYQTKTVEYLFRPDICRTYGVGEMGRINAKAYTGSLTIAGRPELRLGYPIYLPHRDTYHYVTSINHAFDFGGTFTTTLTLSAERRREYDIGNDGKVTNVQVRKIWKLDTKNTLTKEEIDAMYQENQEKKINLRPEALQFLRLGAYKVVDQDQGNIQDAFTNITIPYTDEEGYRVIGAFPYGRGLVLTDKISNPKDSRISDTYTRQEAVAQTVTGASVESDKMSNITETQDSGKVTAISEIVRSGEFLRSNDPAKAVTEMKTKE